MGTDLGHRVVPRPPREDRAEVVLFGGTVGNLDPGARRAIGDPSSTLPVPVPAELAVSHPVTVQGVQGLFIGDNTGIAGAVIWQKDGMMFEVIGSFTESQTIAIANSMR